MATRMETAVGSEVSPARRGKAAQKIVNGSVHGVESKAARILSIQSAITWRAFYRW